ncbi:MAG TPA: DUF748 domain-containing protein [Desulfuromonadaceae bacterium]|jgi:uncharacterized protein involved in outer membrane biogenesis
MSKRKKHTLIAIIVSFSILFFITAILPVIVKSKTISGLEQATGRKIRLESVEINPFTLTFVVKGFSIDEKQGPPLISFSQVRASLALASIYKQALIISKITIDSPAISFARNAPNQYSFSDILNRPKPAPEKEKKEGNLLFSINNITIKNGAVDFFDRIADGGRQHTVRALELNLPFISNIPYLVESYTAPRISAVVNGAPFNFAGQLKPLSKSMETSVHIDLQQLSLPQYVAYSPFKPPADLASGKLTVNTDVSYRISASKKPELIIKGTVRLDNISLNMKEDRPLAKLPLLELKANRLEVFDKLFEFESIRLDGLELYVSRDKKGEWMYSRLLPPKSLKGTSQEQKAESDKKKPLIQVGSFSISNGSVHFEDALPRERFRTHVQDIDIALKNFSTAPAKSALYELSMLLDGEAELNIEGSFSITPLKAKAFAELADLNIYRSWPYLTRYLTAPIKGKLDLSAEASFDKDAGLNIQQGRLAVKDLSTRYGTKEGFDLAELSVEDLMFRQKENRLEVGEIRFSRGGISLSRETDGSLSLLSLLKKQEQQSASSIGAQKLSATTKTAKKTQDRETNPPLSYRLKRIKVDGFNLSFTDKTKEDAPRFTLRKTKLSLSNLNGPRFTPAALQFSSTFGKDSSLKANGQITPLPFHYKGNVNVARLPIRDFESYIPDNINVEIIAGYVDTNMDLDVSLKDNKPVGNFKGSAGVRAFHSIDAVAEEDLLKWESLQFDEIFGNLAPFNLNIHQVALNNVYSRIVVRKDGSLNLQNLVDKEEPTVQATPATPPATPPVKSAVVAAPVQPTSKSQISIGSFTVQDGTIFFTDHHLPQTFSSTFYNLGGRVSGLTSEETKFAEVDLRGNLENHSPLQITGRVNPLRDDLYVDLKVSFTDIELSPVTPYSGTYLGYTVDKGKLFLDLKYLIEKKQLSSENRIFIDQFTFGKKVDSKKATTLPVRLAVALLKDRKGEIHLDLPVTGRTDDPQFSIWSLIGQVLKNLLVKAATSPFALLSSMMGGGQDFSSIPFTPGSSKLNSDAEQKLKLLAKALSERPGLKVEIKGFVDKDRDPEGYRQELLSRKLRNEKLLFLAKEEKLKEGDNVESMQVLPDEYPKFLKAVYKKEKFPKPRNILGMVKDLPDNEMKKLIIANTLVGENELQSLARERAANVMNFLVNKGALPPERLFQKNDDINKAPEKDNISRSRVEFNAIAQ